MASIAAIAVRTGAYQPMKLIDSTELDTTAGVVDDYSRGPRHVTFVAEERWAEVWKQLGKPVPWHTRRANVLTRGLELSEALIGQHLRFGDALIEVRGVTDPCGLMDELEPGLRAVLGNNLRCGLWGRVIEPGRIQIGSPITPTP